MSKVFNMVSGGGGPAASIFVTGPSENDTVTATNGSKTKTGVWTQKPNPAAHGLPDGYTELKYIESTGTQCINTELAENSVYGIRMKFAVPSLVTNHQSLVSGTLDTEFTVGSTTKTTGLYVRIRGDEAFFNDTILSSAVNELVIKVGKISINGSQVATYTAGALSSGSGQLYVFNNNAKSRYSNMFLYELELYDNSDATIRDYVPAKRNSDGAIGMYDLVSNTFFSNSGTGTFVAGAEIPKTIDGFLIKPIRDLGTWTITATDGTKTVTQDVLVDVITEYKIEMDYKLWLYRDGDERIDVTGGWNCPVKSDDTWPLNNGSFDDDCVQLSLIGGGIGSAGMVTKNALNISDSEFTKLKVIAECTNAEDGLYVGFGNTSKYFYNGQGMTEPGPFAQKEITYDFSSIKAGMGAQNIGIGMWGHSACTAKIYKVWLE